MQRYEGTKRLGAQPMTRGEYNIYRGWAIPEGEDPSDAGYLVEYEDGGKANDSRHAGYISWSPADVFERSYKAIPEERTNLAPHQLRVIKERDRVEDDLDKLTAFLATPTFEALPEAEQERLVRQSGVMVQLSDVLAERIAAF